MRWPWRRPVGPPWTFSDATVAAIRDPAARNLLDQLAGQVRELRGRLDQAENVQREHTGRLADVQYREGSTFRALQDADARLRERTLTPEGADTGPK